jgi:transcription antitermination factor NusG
MKQWKAVYVNVRHEKKIQQKLQELDIEAYVPVQRQLRQWSDRKKWVDVVLIGGYVFVRVSPEERDKVFEVEGVLNYVRYDGKDALIKDSEIEQLKWFVENRYTIQLENEKNTIFKKGDIVKLNEGPFKGLTGVVDKEKGKRYILLQIEGLNLNFQVQVPKVLVTKNA